GHSGRPRRGPHLPCRLLNPPNPSSRTPTERANAAPCSDEQFSTRGWCTASSEGHPVSRRRACPAARGPHQNTSIRKASTRKLSTRKLSTPNRSTTMSLTETSVSDRFRDLADRLTGRVVTPAEPDWDAQRQAWNLAADQRPEAVVVAADASDIAVVVGFARDNGLRVVPQGTGHLAAPLGNLAGALLLRTPRLREVEVDVAAASVRVGAGVLWGEVSAALAPHGLAALAGSSPDVGVAGYLLGGGYSWMARKRGLGCSAVTAIDVVTADGRQRHVTADSEPDLF